MAVPLTLYVDAQFLSPYAMSVYVALTEKNLDFELRLVDLDLGEQRMAPFLCRSPMGKVPVLAHHDFYLTESSAITEYLDEAFAQPSYAPLYPSDPQLRARTRQLQAWLRSDLAALRQERPTEVVFEGVRPAALSDAGHACAAKLIRVASAALAHGQANLFGTWTLADTDLALMLNRLILPGDDVPAPLQQYAAAQWQRPSVQRWLHNRKL